MITVEQVKDEIQVGLKDLKGEFLSQSQNQQLKACFETALLDKTLNILLEQIVDQANRLKNPSEFLKKVSMQTQKIIKSYYHNHFRHVLGNFFEPEENSEVITDLDLQSIFATNLIAQLNALNSSRYVAEFEEILPTQSSKPILPWHNAPSQTDCPKSKTGLSWHDQVPNHADHPKKKLQPTCKRQANIRECNNNSRSRLVN